MQAGISIYIGLDNSLEENLQLIENAANKGIKRIFTSFHIPETNTSDFQTQVTDTLKLCKTKNMDVICDVSPNTLKLLGLENLDLAMLNQLGITTMRIDFGFTEKEIAELTHNTCDIKIQLNASTVTRDFLEELKLHKADFSRMDALHNFYPRENTGISENFFNQKNDLLREYGIQIGAFIPSLNRPRSPIKAGLPTLEKHRAMSFDFALRHLIALNVDNIFVGDSLPSDEEINLLSMLAEISAEKNIILLRPNIFTQNKAIRQLLSQDYSARLDEAEDVHRIDGSRQYAKSAKLTITPENTISRLTGSITLDNVNYGRYAGELQIMKKDLPADNRVNVLGALNENEQQLLKYLIPGRTVKFIF